MNYRHGLAHTRIDNIYKSMVDRCNNPNCRIYYKYGGRGIKVCEEWRTNKTSFFEWAFTNGYSEELTLDRADNSKGYSPENCRWVSYKVQANNTRANRLITAFGETKTMSEWAGETGIKSATIWARLKRGWSAEMTLTMPISYKQRLLDKDKQIYVSEVGT